MPSTASSPAPIVVPSSEQRGDFTPCLRLPRNPSLADTPSSIAPSPGKRRSWISVLKTLILIAALVWVARQTLRSADAIQRGELTLHVNAGWLALSAIVYLASNA